jgi:outer membrane protein insertion porin family
MMKSLTIGRGRLRERDVNAVKRMRSGRLVLLVLACAATAGGCGVRTTGADLYPQVAEYQGRRVSEVSFINPAPFPEDSLLNLVDTQPSRCRFLGIPLCVPFTRIGREEHRVNVARIATDVQTLEQSFRIAGYFNTRVTPRVEERGSENVEVTFDIARGSPIVLDMLTVSGTEEVADPDSVARQLPLQPGDIFHLGRFIASSDRLLRDLHGRGYAHAEVLRSFTVDTVDNRAEAALDVYMGPVVRVDSILVRGAPNLGRESVLRQVEVEPGDLLRQSALNESQRNLYQLEIVSLVSVTLAPDSLQSVPGDLSRATVLVSVVEAPLRELEAAVGFGTQECLRTEAQWVHRSFGGGARRLSVSGSLSRLGVGEPFAIGAGRRICPRVPGDEALGGDQFDYRLSANWTQPFFISARNQISLSAFAERVAEPGVYQRQAVGSQVGLSRRLGARSGGSALVEVERGSTRASPALFCAAFLVCEPETVDSLSGPRFRTELGGNYFVDRANAPLDPTAGFVARTTVSHAARWLGSDVSFFRWSGSGAAYREVGARSVGALSLRLGNFFRTATLGPSGDFLPPEDRFYAGGATSVRGYERNGLGPGIYVTDAITVTEGDTVPDRSPQFVPTGGTSVAVASAELRMPSPVWPELMRMVAFVDGGAVGSGAVWDIAGEQWRFTPGVGVRLITPVGPLRVDVAYNPYERPVAPLLFSDVATGRVIRIADRYQQDRPSVWGRLRVHLGIGQAF